MAAFGIGPLIAASVGIILLGLLRTPLRWSGAAVLVLAVVWALAVPQPDILISADGHNVGVRGKDGRLHLMRTAKDAFLLKEWLAADADARQPPDPSLAEGVSCDEAGCVAQMADGGLVALALRPEALADDCERAALVVTARQAPAACAAPVIDRDRLRRQGALALRRSRDGFAVEAVRPKGVDRPWSPAVAGETEAEASLRRAAPSARGRCDAVGSRPAGGGLRRADGRPRVQLPLQLLAATGTRIVRQFERAEMKFLVASGIVSASASLTSCLTSAKPHPGIAPDREILRVTVEPAEREHVAAGLGRPARPCCHVTLLTDNAPDPVRAAVPAGLHRNGSVGAPAWTRLRAIRGYIGAQHHSMCHALHGCVPDTLPSAVSLSAAHRRWRHAASARRRPQYFRYSPISLP